MAEIRVYTDLSNKFYIGQWNSTTNKLSNLMLIMPNPQTKTFVPVPANILTEGHKFVDGYIADVDPDERGWVQCMKVQESITNMYREMTSSITIARGVDLEKLMR